MKDITRFINESNNTPIFMPDKSEIRSDGKTLVGAIYSEDMKITDHAESYEEAVTYSVEERLLPLGSSMNSTIH